MHHYSLKHRIVSVIALIITLVLVYYFELAIKRWVGVERLAKLARPLRYLISALGFITALAIMIAIYLLIVPMI